MDLAPLRRLRKGKRIGDRTLLEARRALKSLVSSNLIPSAMIPEIYYKIKERFGFKPNDCICHRCIAEKDLRHPSMPQFPLSSGMMILCPECGNKRCPKASDHDLACTNSNDSGQPGSIY